MNNEGCMRHLLAGFIWLGSPPIFLILMPIISGCEGPLVGFINFIIGIGSIIVSAIAISGLTLIKGFIGLFRRTKNNHPESQTNKDKPPKLFGISSIPISTAIFVFAGFLASLLSYKGINFNSISIYAMIGIIWGGIVYLLFQNGIFEADEF